MYYIFLCFCHGFSPVLEPNASCMYCNFFGSWNNPDPPYMIDSCINNYPFSLFLDFISVAVPDPSFFLSASHSLLLQFCCWTDYSIIKLISYWLWSINEGKARKNWVYRRWDYYSCYMEWVGGTLCKCRGACCQENSIAKGACYKATTRILKQKVALNGCDKPGTPTYM
jgi:hypothetical protein